MQRLQVDFAKLAFMFDQVAFRTDSTNFTDMVYGSTYL